MTYNYLEEMLKDVKETISEMAEITLEDVLYNRDELEEKLNDEFFVEDAITGNASGSYTFCRATAKKYVLDNMGMCMEALKEFCVDAETIADKFLSEDWEYFDVTIRCYNLGSVISQALDELAEEAQKEEV
jgi:hypothetical protein